MDWLEMLKTVLIPVGLGFLGIYFGYVRGRRDAFREALYVKQIEGFTDILNAMGDILNDLIVFINEYNANPPLKQEQDLPECCAAIKVKLVELRRSYYKWASFLPAETCGKVIGFLLEEYSPPEHNIEALQEMRKRYTQVYTDFVTNSRMLLGVAPLSNETLKLIGAVSRK